MSSYQLSRRFYQVRRLFSRIEISPQKVLKLSRPPQRSEIALATLKRLGYLFSCGGNVTYRSDGKQYAITVNSVHRWMPMEFLESFKGNITIRSGQGGSRPAFFWRIGGKSAIDIALELAVHAGRKRELLELFGSTKDGTRSQVHINRVQQTLEKVKSDLRQSFFKAPRVNSWSEFSQVLDCRGSIGFVPTTRAIRILITHRNRDLLVSMSTFLAKSGAPTRYFPKVYRLRCFKTGFHSYAWDLQGKLLSPFVLRNTLAHGLLLQKEKATTILKSFEENMENQEYLPSRCNHKRHKCLSDGEVQLSRLILTLRQRRKRISTNKGGLEEVNHFVKSTWEEREISKRRTELRRLRAEVRDLLSR